MPKSVMDVIRRGPYARHQIQRAADELERFNIDDVQLLPPIIPWATFVSTANASDPAEAERLQTDEFPTVSLRTPRNHVGEGEVLDIPLKTKQLEIESKLAVVLAKGGRYIKQEHALKHIFGYALYNEGSVKDYQAHTSQFGVGKMFDLSSGFGPFLTTEDEVGDIYQRSLETRINGELVRSTPISSMRHTIEDIIVYISSAVTMFPGDVIMMSIPTGESPNPERIAQPDDRVETTLSGVATLTSIIGDEPSEPRTMGCC